MYETRQGQLAFLGSAGPQQASQVASKHISTTTSASSPQMVTILGTTPPYPVPFLMFSWANCQKDHGVDNTAASAISRASWHLMTHISKTSSRQTFVRFSANEVLVTLFKSKCLERLFLYAVWLRHFTIQSTASTASSALSLLYSVA
jgi:hypothetical protein